MGRSTELSQDAIDDAAEQLTGQGRRPSPNTVREIVGSGSFSTIKKMLDVWQDKQINNETIPVPEIPEFVYRHVEKLHRELYLQNHRLFDAERSELEAVRNEFEAEKKEMIDEIKGLEEKLTTLRVDLKDLKSALTSTQASLAKSQTALDKATENISKKNTEIATLSERVTQLDAQTKEKDSLLKKAEKRENALQATIDGFIKKKLKA